jgi:cytochrome c oxidase assembly protein subunit 15
MNTSPWPHRFALATFVLTLLLVLVGSQVTTIGAGMAVKGWWIVDGSDGQQHFLPLFPGSEWTRDIDTFYEHTHRMLGMAVGLAAIVTLVTTLVARLGRGARTMAAISLGAIVIQGVIGGTRVLENSAHLAFLHGVTGQVTLVLVGLAALFTSSAWQSIGAGRSERTPSTLAKVLVGITLAQITLGAWYRHGLRSPDLDTPPGALHMHMTVAFVVLGLVIALAIRLTLLARDLEGAAPELARRVVVSKKRLHALVGTQILLGFLAWAFYADPEYVSVQESVFAALHLLVGALLFLQTAAIVVWLGRAGAREVAA